MKFATRRSHRVHVTLLTSDTGHAGRPVTMEGVLQAVAKAGPVLGVYPPEEWRRGSVTDLRGWSWTNEAGGALYDVGDGYVVLQVRAWKKRAPSAEQLRRAVEFEKARREADGGTWGRALAVDVKERLRLDMIRSTVPDVYDVPVVLELKDGAPRRLIVVGSTKDALDAQQRVARLLDAVTGEAPWVSTPYTLAAHLQATRPGAYLPWDDVADAWGRWTLAHARDCQWMELTTRDPVTAVGLALNDDLQVHLSEGNGDVRVKGSAAAEWVGQRLDDGETDRLDYVMIELQTPDGAIYALRVAGNGSITHVTLPPLLPTDEDEDEHDAIEADLLLTAGGLFGAVDLVSALFHGFDVSMLPDMLGSLPQLPLYPLPERSDAAGAGVTWHATCPEELRPAKEEDERQLNIDPSAMVGELADAMATARDALRDVGITGVTVSHGGREVSILPEHMKRKPSRRGGA